MASIVDKIDEACDKGTSLGEFTVSELKVYLRSRGQHVSGKKAELINRALGAHRLGLTDINLDAYNDWKICEKEASDRLKTPVGDQYSHPSEIKKWTTDVSLIPELTEKDIYNYFVFKLQVKRQLKAKIMYEDRHLHSLEVNISDENDTHCFVRAKVIPSMPTANKTQCPDYKVWVMLSKVTGCINSAECTCVAGYNGDGCNHIAALLYGIADVSTQKRDGKLAPTSLKCKWLNPRKRKLTPKKAEELDFRKVKQRSDSSNVKKCLSFPRLVKTTSVNVDRFKEKLLKNNSNAGWLKNFKLPKTNNESLPKLHNVKFNFIDSADLFSSTLKTFFKEYLESLKLSLDDCQKVEVLTRDQRRSDFWMEARHERITASNFGKVIKAGATPSLSVLKDVFGYATFENKYTKYGQTHEAAARKSYQRHMRDTHHGISVKQCGLLTTPELPYLGASPDGLVNCTHCEESNGLLEIKCPASLLWRMKTPEQCSEDKKFYCELKDGKVQLKRSHNYFYQVQGQLGMSGRLWCDFVVWTCVGISVERIYFDRILFSEMVNKLRDFYMYTFLPELFSQRVRRGMQLGK